MTQRECNDFLEYVLNMGRLMVQSGAEVWRVEDSITRICNAYKIFKVEVYVSTTLLVATIKDENGTTCTQSARVGQISNNLGALEALNGVSRNICANKPLIEDIPKITREALDSVKTGYYNLIGYILAALGFTIFFGGDLVDGIVAGAIGIIVFYLDRLAKVEDGNKLIITMINSFISGVIAIFLVKIGIGHNIDKIIIGVVMLFIPALALVNGARDMFYRNIITGIFRVMEAILIATAIAFGFGLAMYLMGGIL